MMSRVRMRPVVEVVVARWVGFPLPSRNVPEYLLIVCNMAMKT